MTSRLSNSSLPDLPKSVQQPDYDRASVTAGIVHLGVGAFQRAHQAFYVDGLLAQHLDWGIIGASLRRPDTRDALEPQDWLYTLAVRDGSGTKCRIIGSFLEVIDGTKDADRLMNFLCDPAIRIVTLTVTEKGYCHDPATGELDPAHPDIAHDLANPATPRSAPGILVEALARRDRAGTAPFTVMSCDNLPSNGATARRIVARFAALRDPALGAFVAKEVAFPSTMVDRIVPATTDEDRASILAETGVEDAWPVVTEPFTQWVIEDNFPQGRPPFEDVGAQMVGDVEPFEHMKLRMLNGSHSSMAYLGYLAGHETIAQVTAAPEFAGFVTQMMNSEIIPTLDMPGTDLFAYRDALMGRFANPALKHRTWQIAMDGSQKLPQRLLGTIRDRLAAGQSYDRLALGVAGWMRYAAGTDEKGVAIDVRDPMAARFAALGAAAAGDATALVDGFLAIADVFRADLGGNDGFRALLVSHMRALLQDGAAKTVARLVN